MLHHAAHATHSAHATHAAHAAHATHAVVVVVVAAVVFLFLGNVGDRAIRWSAAGRRRWPRSAGRVRATFAGSTTPAFEQVAVLVGVGVVAVVLVLELADAVDDDRAVEAGVLGDRAQRHVEDVADDLRAELLRRLRA